jgi:hypothetical protein
MSITVSFNDYAVNPGLRDPYLEKSTGQLVKKLLDNPEISQRLHDETYDASKVQEFERTATLTQRAFLAYVSFGVVSITRTRMQTLYGMMKNLGASEELLTKLEASVENFKSKEKVEQAANVIKGYLVDKFDEEPLIAQSLADLADLRKEKLQVLNQA